MSVATRRKFTPQFRAQAVDLANHGSRSVAEVAADLEVRPSLLYRWIREASSAHATGQSGGAEGEADLAREVRRLRREVAELRMDNDILKKAAVIMGSKPASKDGK